MTTVNLPQILAGEDPDTVVPSADEPRPQAPNPTVPNPSSPPSGGVMASTPPQETSWVERWFSGMFGKGEKGSQNAMIAGVAAAVVGGIGYFTGSGVLMSLLMATAAAGGFLLVNQLNDIAQSDPLVTSPQTQASQNRSDGTAPSHTQEKSQSVPETQEQPETSGHGLPEAARKPTSPAKAPEGVER